jgi:hypothetical protein
MNDANDRERLFVARCSLVLFIAGLLVPLIIAGVGAGFCGGAKTETAAFFSALGLGLIAGVLALVFGILGRRYLSGKIGMIGGALLLMLALLVVASLVWPRNDPTPHVPAGGGPGAKATEKAADRPGATMPKKAGK